MFDLLGQLDDRSGQLADSCIVSAGNSVLHKALQALLGARDRRLCLSRSQMECGLVNLSAQHLGYRYAVIPHRPIILRCSRTPEMTAQLADLGVDRGPSSARVGADGFDQRRGERVRLEVREGVVKRVEEICEQVPPCLVASAPGGTLAYPVRLERSEVPKGGIETFNAHPIDDGAKGKEGVTHVVVGHLLAATRTERGELVVYEASKRSRDLGVIAFGEASSANCSEQLPIGVTRMAF